MAYVQTYNESMMAAGASLALVDSVVCALLNSIETLFSTIALLSNATCGIDLKSGG